MKSCIHDYTDLQDQCDCYVPHTNFGSTGMPVTSLTKHIAQLERERGALRGQLVSTLKERNIFAEQLRISRSAAT